MLSIVRIHNELLGTYGNRGNAEVLAFRAHLNGLGAVVADVGYRDPLPSGGDIYLLGGAEDAAQVLSLTALSADKNFASAISNGAVLLAVCAGFQIIGKSFTNGAGETVQGLDLLDVSTVPGDRGYVGDIKVRSDIVKNELTGFENHGGKTILGATARPFAKVISGFGNGDSGVDGAISGNIFGTYLHGPVLARNPEFADHLLALVAGEKAIGFTDELALEYAAWRREVTR
jgi:CobQ-like glutamine amidotransferase family enzyme